MKIIEPITMTDAILSSSTVPENDHSEWDLSTTYDEDDEVILTSTHKVYQSLVGSNLGNDPTEANSAYWVEVEATNRWKAFDGVISNPVSQSGSIQYVFNLNSLTFGFAFFGLDASSVRVQIEDDSATEIYDETKAVVDNTFVVDWLTWTEEEVIYDTEVLFFDVPGRAGYTATVTIDAGAGTAEVGQIAMGKVYEIGDVVAGTTVGFKDYSTKTTDDFGNLTIVPRAYSQTVEFEFAFATKDARRILRILSGLRATPAVYCMDGDSNEFATTVYGSFPDFEAPLNAGDTSFSSIKIEGLT